MSYYMDPSVSFHDPISSNTDTQMAFQSNNNGMPDGSAPMNGGGMDGQFPGAPNMQASAVQTVTNEAARTLWYVYLLPLLLHRKFLIANM